MSTEYKTVQSFNPERCETCTDEFKKRTLANRLISEIPLSELEKLFTFVQNGVDDYDPDDYPNMTPETIQKIRSCYDEWSASVNI